MFSPQQSVLLVIDVQGNLAQQMVNKDAVYKNIAGLIKAANILNVPVIATEQAPENIGSTILPIQNELKENKCLAKYSFSCCGEIKFIDALIAFNRKQIVITGIESHVCVMQTAIDLINRDYSVQVVADCVSSRKVKNLDLSLSRMRDKGADITSTEMIVTEWLGTAKHPNFKDILSLIK